MNKIILIILLFTVICSIPFLIPEEDESILISSAVTYHIALQGDDLTTFSDIGEVVDALTR